MPRNRSNPTRFLKSGLCFAPSYELAGIRRFKGAHRHVLDETERIWCLYGQPRAKKPKSSSLIPLVATRSIRIGRGIQGVQADVYTTQTCCSKRTSHVFQEGPFCRQSHVSNAWHIHCLVDKVAYVSSEQGLSTCDTLLAYSHPGCHLNHFKDFHVRRYVGTIPQPDTLRRPTVEVAPIARSVVDTCR